MAAPLSDLLSSKSDWKWEKLHQVCFKSLTEALCAITVLWLPDFSKLFMVDDALDQVVEAIFLKPYGDKLHPAANFSKKYYPAERNYPEYKKLLAIFKLAKSRVARWAFHFCLY